MSLILGVIFKDLIPLNLLLKPKKYDASYGLNEVNGIYHYKQKTILDKIKDYFDSDFWFSMLMIAPAIVLHELSHKVVAQYLGLNATFYAAYNFLAFAILMKLIFPLFLFFVPGYVMSYCTSAGAYCVASASGLVPTYSASAMIAFAGPFANLILFLISSYLLTRYNSHSAKTKNDKIIVLALVITKKLNLLLFGLNMLPIPGFDGFHVYYNLYKLFF